MDKYKSDIFEGIKSGNKVSSNVFENSSSNFFLNAEKPLFGAVKPSKNESSRRLNDYDFNLLKEDAYKDVSDDLFKLEYKISRTEEEIRNLDLQIQAAHDIHDEALIAELVNRQGILQEDYEALVAIYNDRSLSARISDGISGFIGKKFNGELNLFKEKFSNISESILSKMPKQFSSLIELKRSLNKLENINKSVDELVNMNIPYGENIDKYEQLSKYIIKANSIQSEISRQIKRK